ALAELLEHEHAVDLPLGGLVRPGGGAQLYRVLEPFDGEVHRDGGAEDLLPADVEFVNGGVDEPGLAALEVSHVPLVEDEFPLGLTAGAGGAGQEQQRKPGGARTTHEGLLL